MEYRHHKSYLLADKSYASLIKKDIRKIAQSVGFDGSRLGEVEIVASEIISNLIKHSTKGSELLVKPIVCPKGNIGIELISIDNGPGMLDPYKMMADGVSTTGTLGQGLGAMKRLSDDFEIYSQKEWGTLVLCRLYIDKPENASKKPAQSFKINTIMVPKPGEEFCGDGWAMRKEGTNYVIMAADGLGHGPDAYKASKEATDHFKVLKEHIPSEIILSTHEKIKKTRGIVGGVLWFDQKNKIMTYCGIGNISTRIFLHDKAKAFVSYNGIIGVNKPTTIHNQTLEADGAVCIILTSDGITTRWDLSKHPALLRMDGSMLAAQIYKDHSRRTDDSLVIIARTVK